MLKLSIKEISHERIPLNGIPLLLIQAFETSDVFIFFIIRIIGCNLPINVLCPGSYSLTNSIAIVKIFSSAPLQRK